MVRIEVGLMVIGVALAGCVFSPPHEPPILIFEDIWYWFEDDLIVLNFTIVNVGNLTPGGEEAPLPSLRVKLGEFAYDGSDHAWNTENIPALAAFESIGLFFVDGEGSPLQERYWDHELSTPEEPWGGWFGPIDFGPGSRNSFEMVFKPENVLREWQGFYQFEMDILHVNRETHAPLGEHRSTGCFNHDVEEFYGVHPAGYGCLYLSPDGTWTGGDPLDVQGTPTMKLGPPPGR